MNASKTVRRQIGIAGCLVAQLAIGVSFASESQEVLSGGVSDTSGLALAEVWVASPAQYQATAEVILEAVDATNYQTVGAFDAAVTELLVMFTGGNGAAQDVVDRKVIDSSEVNNGR